MTGLARSRWLGWVTGIGAVLAVWLVVFSVIPTPENWGHDLPLLVDAGWRSVSGQTPHVDFHSALGSLPIEMLGFGLRFAEPSVTATFVGVGVGWLVLGLAAWGVTAVRAPAVTAAAVGAWVTLLAGAPRPLGFPLEFVTAAMFYNRMCEAVLVTVMIGAFVPASEGRSRPARTAAWLAVAIGGLLVTKLSYAAVGMGSAVVGGWMRRRPWWEGLTVVAGGAAAAVALLLAFGVSPTAFVADMASTVAAQDVANRGARLARVVALNAVPLVAVMTAAAVVVRELGPRAVESVHALTAAGFGAVMGVALCATNYQERELPLVAAAAVVIAIRGVAAGVSGRRRLAVVGLAVVLPLALAVRDAAGVRRALELRARPPAGPVHVRAEPLADVVVAVPGWVPVLHEGLELLRQVGVDGRRVLVTDLSNPFSFALGMQPPIGDALWWHAGKTFSRRVHPAADEVFATVDLVLEPMRPVDAPTVELM